VVRAHPTVPAPSQSIAICISDPTTPACQPSAIHPLFSQQSLRGNYDVHWLKEFSTRFDAGHRAFNLDVSERRPRLYSRTAAGLQRRCLSVLRLRNSRRRSRHGLHDPQQGTPLAGLQGPLPRRSRAPRGGGCSHRQANEHQAGCAAKARRRQGEKAQKASQACQHLIGNHLSHAAIAARARQASFQVPHARQMDPLRRRAASTSPMR
jgi:hypothetical protein